MRLQFRCDLPNRNRHLAIHSSLIHHFFSKYSKELFLLLLLFNGCKYSLLSQSDSVAYVFQDAIENTVAASSDLSFDYDTEFEHLKDFIRHPLNINKASIQDFEKLKLLTAEQIEKIIAHRTKNGLYITLYELQSVIDLNTIYRILPFIMIDGSLDDFQVPLKEWFKKGKHDAFTRIERRLETSKGFSEGKYKGDANKIYMRYRYSFGKHLSYGMTLEKDAGEKWNAQPDFTSFHFRIADFHPRIKAISVGDYAVSLGQGLIHENAFALGKSSLVMSIEKNAPPVKQYTSSNEANFMRGVAIELKTAPNTEGVLFASYRPRDGNKISGLQKDSLDESLISALQFSGLHRTQNEIDDKNAVGLFTLGGRISKKIRRGSINFNSVFNQFDKKLSPAEEPYNLNTFRGTTLLNTSTDYKYTFQNAHFFGETAVSNNLGYATLNGLLLGLDKKLSLGILQRYFSLKYQALNAQPFAESSKVNDENGIYIGANLKLNKKWHLDAYTDFWRHKWWRYQVDAPSTGREFFIKTAYKSKYTEGYLQFRLKTKQENSSVPSAQKVNSIVDKTKSQIRFNIQHRLSKEWTLRNRLECSFYDDNPLNKQLNKGFMVYQDVIWKHKIPHGNFSTPLSISARLAYFDTPNYDTAIYAYENDLTYNFTVLPYYYKGTRFYVNASYGFNKNYHFEIRIARTRLFDDRKIGSGLDALDKSHRTDIKAQFHVEF